MKILNKIGFLFVILVVFFLSIEAVSALPFGSGSTTVYSGHRYPVTYPSLADSPGSSTFGSGSYVVFSGHQYPLRYKYGRSSYGWSGPMNKESRFARHNYLYGQNSERYFDQPEYNLVSRYTGYGSSAGGINFKRSADYGSKRTGSTFKRSSDYGSRSTGSTFKRSSDYGSGSFGSTFKRSTDYGSGFRGTSFKRSDAYGSGYSGGIFKRTHAYGSGYY